MRKAKWWIAAVAVVSLAAVWTVVRHANTEAGGERPGLDRSVERAAAVVKVERGNLGAPLTLAGAFKPFQEVDVHAKVAGFIKEIYVDVGSHVKEGQTLAILEVPELAAELTGAEAARERAKEEVTRAQSDLQGAKSTNAAVHAMYQRLRQAAEQREGLVAQQEVDDAEAKDQSSAAQVSSAQAALSASQQALAVARANYEQYKALSAYTRITAPYTGVVTVRYADTGSLIAAGTSESKQAEPVVRLAQVSLLRLVLPIPESIAGSIHVGDAIKVHADALNEDTVGKVTRFADELNEETRTMHTEVDFQNPDGKLLPGMYVVATVPQVQKANILTLPVEAVERKDNSEGTVLFVNAQNVLEERQVKLGAEGNTRIEITGGLREGDRVVVGSRSEFRNGMKVTPKEMDNGERGTAGGR